MLRDLLQRLDQVLRDARREELRWTSPRRLTSLHSFAILSVKRSFSAQDMDVKQLSASLTVLLGLLRLLLPHRPPEAVQRLLDRAADDVQTTICVVGDHQRQRPDGLQRLAAVRVLLQTGEKVVEAAMGGERNEYTSFLKSCVRKECA